jgi:hypothetical protein
MTFLLSPIPQLLMQFAWLKMAGGMADNTLNTDLQAIIVNLLCDLRLVKLLA